MNEKLLAYLRTMSPNDVLFHYEGRVLKAYEWWNVGGDVHVELEDVAMDAAPTPEPEPVMGGRLK
jgi:hypothetical protein